MSKRPIALALLLLTPPAWALQPLNETELAAVSGREGITIDLQLRLDADASGAPLGPGMKITLHDSNGNPDTRSDRWCLFFCSRNPEYLGGAYLVADGIYGSVNITGLTLDSDGEAGLVIGLPSTVEVPYFQIGFLRAEATPDGAGGPTLGSLSLQGSFDMTGRIRLWGH